MKRAILPVLVGLWGGATMLAMSGFLLSDPALVLAASLGATLAGAICAPLFCRARRLWVLLAAPLATTIGASLVGGYVGYPGDLVVGLTVAPVMVWAAILQDPPVLLVWLLGAFAVHLTARLPSRHPAVKS
jgi:hypothetical protein